MAVSLKLEHSVSELLDDRETALESRHNVPTVLEAGDYGADQATLQQLLAGPFSIDSSCIGLLVSITVSYVPGRHQA